MNQEKLLIEVIDQLAKLSRPIIFKYVSAAGLTDEDFKKLYQNIEQLKENASK